MKAVFPNSLPGRPPNVSMFPITTLPLTSNSPLVASVPIPTLLVDPSMYIEVEEASSTTVALLVILKSPCAPVIPTDQPAFPFT